MMEDTLSIVGTGLVVVVTIVLFQRHRMSAYVIPPLDLSTDEDIEVSPMKESEFEIALDIAANAFVKNNPVVSHLGLSVEVFKKFTRSEHSIDCNVKSGLSLVARVKGDKKPMAFLFMSDFDVSART